MPLRDFDFDWFRIVPHFSHWIVRISVLFGVIFSGEVTQGYGEIFEGSQLNGGGEKQVLVGMLRRDGIRFSQDSRCCLRSGSEDDDEDDLGFSFVPSCFKLLNKLMNSSFVTVVLPPALRYRHIASQSLSP